MGNLTAGIGTPYWYEWSVGLLYIVKMLNPDNQIKNVVLQSEENQSLDDVVVTFEDGTIQYIQVKNTREDDKLTYTDMIEGEVEKSYLYKYSFEWKMMENKNKGKNKVVLFTNREIGERKYTRKNEWERPPLSSFWKSIKKQADDLARVEDQVPDINKIIVKKEWEKAWDAWKKCMKELDEKEQLHFLQNFELLTDQEDLEELINVIADELQKKFKTTREKAVGLHQKLCYQLMWWSTSIGEKKEIEKEDVMQALSLSEDEIKGNHIIPLCEPFFQSRIEFIELLEKIVLNGKTRMTFLTGNPGCGKTNIISYLASKPDSIVTLRFHAFKPIIPGEEYISADAGVSDPKDFWGSLLIMLRKLFKGKLCEYSVPISIELIESVDDLRSEVFRLASDWADITGRPTVIAIDGIDHAARSGNKNTFLKTLISPEAVPENVRIILAGQPVHQFSEYPDFLSDPSRIETIEVPDIQKEDLALLYEKNEASMKYNDFDKILVLNYILEIAKGNTLSAVFAIQEAVKYSSFEDFEKNSNVKTLNLGVQSYYEYIWKSTIRQGETIGYTIDMYLAVVFSIINRKISAKNMADIFGNGIQVWQWEEILQNLFPIINYVNGEYCVFHNDIRVFLTSHCRKGNQLLPDIKEKIADFLLNEDFDAKIKHEIVFKLLADAEKKERYVDVFTSEYVIEAYALRRDPREINNQMLSTLEVLPIIEDKKKIVKFTCAVATMQQRDETLQWLDEKYLYDVEIPFALESEKRFITDEMLSLDDYTEMFLDIKTLERKHEYSRAKKILERWMYKITPDTLFHCLIQKCEKGEINRLLEIWGGYARKFKVAPQKMDYQNECEKDAAAFFYKGWLKEAVKCRGKEQLKYTLQNISWFFTEDINNFLFYIIKNGDIDEVKYILSDGLRDHFSENNKLIICAWAIRNNEVGICEEWSREIKDKGFNYLSEEWFDYNDFEINKENELFKIIVDLMYVLSYESEGKYSVLKKSALKKCKFVEDELDEFVAGHILASVAQIAYMEKCILEEGIDKLELQDFERMIDFNLDVDCYKYYFKINTLLYRKRVIASIIRIVDMLPYSFKQSLQVKLCGKAEKCDEVALFEIYWKYLKKIGRPDLIEHFFDTWMQRDGEIWRLELSERGYVSNILLKIAEGMGWTDRIQKASKLLNARSIGYVGRKDYSLFMPLYWLERTAKTKGDIWKTYGCLLMNISEYASKIGDNRAYIHIGSSIAAVAGNMGKTNLLQFANMVKETNSRWKELVFDGIISALEFGFFTEKDLSYLWKKAVECFPVNKYLAPYSSKNNRNKIYCMDVLKAIILCAQRLGYAKFENYLKENVISEYITKETESFKSSSIIPSRWYDTEYYNNVKTFIDSTKKMNCDEIFSYIETQVNEGAFSWDYIRFFVQMAQKEDFQSILNHKPQIMQMLSKRAAIPLKHDGCDRLYEVLFQYLTDDEVNDILKSIIDTYYSCRDQGWLSINYGLMLDLENFTFSLFSRFSEEDNICALQEILQMHCLWLNGAKTLEIGAIYQLDEEKVVSDWEGFFKLLEL